MNVALESPEMLLLIIPVIVAGFYLLRKTKTKLVEWRMLVALLLVLALAAPYTTVTQTISEEDPSLVLVQDQTASMGIFPEETGTDLYQALTADTPTALVQLTGEKTSLGDAVTQYSGLGNQIVLVTDGNSNSGKDFSDALKFAKDADTPVYLVQPELETNDLSVEMLGDKTVVVNNQNEFEIVVRQASEQSVSYFLEIFVDGQLSQSRQFTQDTRDNTIPINQAFKTLGAHNMNVRITPSGEDLNAVNNEFYKSIYVIPKPKLTLVTGETGSPLAKVLSNLYEVSVVNGYPGAGNLTDSKVLVLDNQFIDTFSEAEIKEIKNYVSNGGGLIVVGGNQAYNYGKYLNSSLEEVLPVISKPSEYKGGRNLVLMLDVSPSTAAHGTQGDILSNAIHILRNENIKDANVGVIAFGSVGYDVSGGFVFMGLPQNLALLEDQISQLTPGDQTKTSLDQGLSVTKEMLEGEDGELDAIIISDGGIEDSYDQSLTAARELKDMGVKLYFIHIRSSAPSQIDKTRTFYAEKLMQELGLETNYQHLDMGERTNIGFEDIVTTPEEDENKSEDIGTYPLLEYSPDHFITKNVNLTTASITGYNQVTPKAGAERLVITITGQPVLTTWRFGLGRVAAFTTDNGGSEATRWASALYNGTNSKLISGTANWAIGNPQAEEGAVVEALDTWLGTPSDLTLIMYDEGVPQLKLDGSPLDLALTGRNTYEASVNPDKIGIHDISGYPLAVNYPLEYLEVGFNNDIEPLILATGGKIYTEKEARALLLKDARQNSERDSNDPVSLKVYVLLAALVLYLGEILVRRIREMRRLKKSQGETGA
ncbi:MAG: VWA domain-containing protein [Methanosarcina sp.]|uniref:VWA domain-containing protein n=1 Tax=Methanosarcina sp. TaxID=2213 RepID=UPI00261A6F55|nr:VWA domain-containing protein [Methanosarcina sp.]MDD3247061.1 VWA domain-containing protein [Methanosarcina sp.]